MKWYIIMIPFLALFLYTGLKWQLYSIQINEHDSYSENALYSSIELDNLRNYKMDVLNKDFNLNLIKFISLERTDNNDNEIDIKNNKPLFINILTKTNYLDVMPSIRKSYILDSTI